ncbi:hypothetical protein [Anaeromicrobium sediminis]|uniref:Uncharacterized protein n=1 Tax=Anaeromicrobium sediminis TaxID=1478221 RepID=A0A267MK19_9FIRM|nr:hypothetical protein [Anaeromicrobium sediminis]PAB59924.1 hypothetical protein CCE28_08195 [Anaeromicrobium sediminis]
MSWIILFIVSWIMFFIAVDFKMLKYTIWSGLLTALIEVSIDILYTGHKLYKTVNNVFETKGISIFFIFSVPIVIGTLMSQYYPKKKLYRILNIFIISILFYAVEFILVLKGDLIYINWIWIESLIIDLLTMMSISWFNLVVLNKWRESVP